MNLFPLSWRTYNQDTLGSMKMGKLYISCLQNRLSGLNAVDRPQLNVYVHHNVAPDGFTSLEILEVIGRELLSQCFTRANFKLYQVSFWQENGPSLSR